MVCEHQPQMDNCHIKATLRVPLKDSDEEVSSMGRTSGYTDCPFCMEGEMTRGTDLL